MIFLLCRKFAETESNLELTPAGLFEIAAKGFRANKPIFNGNIFGEKRWQNR